MPMNCENCPTMKRYATPMGSFCVPKGSGHALALDNTAEIPSTPQHKMVDVCDHPLDYALGKEINVADLADQPFPLG